jgi:hypothetical protein
MAAVTKIAAKATDEDTAGLEAELDKMLYGVYGLTEDETKVVVEKR